METWTFLLPQRTQWTNNNQILKSSPPSERKCDSPSCLHHSADSQKTTLMGHLILCGCPSTGFTTSTSGGPPLYHLTLKLSFKFSLHRLLSPHSPQFRVSVYKSPFSFLHAQVHILLLWLHQEKHESPNPKEQLLGTHPARVSTREFAKDHWASLLLCLVFVIFWLSHAGSLPSWCLASWSKLAEPGSWRVGILGSSTASPESGLQQMEGDFPDMAGAVWVITMRLALYRAHFPGVLNFPGWGTFWYSDEVLIAGKTWIPKLGRSMWWWQQCLQI